MKSLEFLDNWTHDLTFFKFFKMIAASLRVVEITLENCNISDVFYDSFAFCFVHDCSMVFIGNNIDRNIYSLTSSVGSMFKWFFAGCPLDYENVYNFGANLGTILIGTIGYTPINGDDYYIPDY